MSRCRTHLTSLKNKKLFIFIAASGFAIDRLAKFLVRENLGVGDSITVIEKFFRLTHITNTGIAFGMAQGNNVFFIIVSFAILSLLIYFFVNTENARELLPLTLIAAGAAGNIYDRLIYGSVCDFLEFNLGFPPFNPWPIFNAADAMITIGGVILFYLEFIRKRPD
ncbi:signal peptidase II [bacterium]|nr:signal peptidase II [bacterium]MBU4133895.1 signal peptidase II [bacterium]